MLGITSFTEGLSLLLAWFIIIILIYVVYQKLDEKPKWWAALIIVVVGMFSFDFSFTFTQFSLSIPILPLGVWLLILIFKWTDNTEIWPIYKPFAWLGFLSLFLFIITKLLVLPVDHFMYPEEELSTYMSDVENASVMKIHPSGDDVSLDDLEPKIDSMQRDSIRSIDWYNDLTHNPDPDSNEVDARFPYLLTGVEPKWGSDLETMIYVEHDGKGLLVTSSDHQYYFRSEDSLLKEGVE
ncbi:hypothetical protein [Aquisalibacillus elongatus]|uniref:Uncharacterized protein n=1 Tax=Aquisalibacillus elongatus TaxID=485577 RepID=A0A3N5BAH1_9BACI|nr:hypothetical protein [Aquisalibacillus elongatus]RPF54403.1 hypothetical protein EDC24_1601 [Aquisalibacillus elongatus]